jgi:hypothetical protein
MICYQWDGLKECASAIFCISVIGEVETWTFDHSSHLNGLYKFPACQCLRCLISTLNIEQ